jgi:hypothetical protein
MASIGHGGKLEDPRAGLEPEKLEACEPGVQQSCEWHLIHHLRTAAAGLLVTTARAEMKC